MMLHVMKRVINEMISNEGTMMCTISQDKVFKFLEWIFFIGLCIVSVWFVSGDLKQFYTNKTSFAQYEEKITEYPVITIALYSQNASEVNLTNVIMSYSTEGMKHDHKLEIGENHFPNVNYKKIQNVHFGSEYKMFKM